MLRKLLALSSLALVGCATTQGTVSGTPKASYASAKSADAVTDCLSDGLGFLVGGPAVKRSPQENLITFNTGSYAYLVIAAHPEGSGSRIDVHHRLSYPAKVRRAVEACL